MLNIKPAGNANKREPNCASFKCRRACSSGILDAQVAKMKPEMKKKVFTDTRMVRGENLCF